MSGSPSTFYPSRSTYHETFARVVPTTAQEAEAITAEMHSLGLTKLYVADDGSPTAPRSPPRYVPTLSSRG